MSVPMIYVQKRQSYRVDQIYTIKKNSDEKQNLSSNESKAIINNLIDLIDFLKYEIRVKDQTSLS